MSTFAEDHAAATLPMLLETHGATHTYQPAGSDTASTITAAIGKETMLQDIDETGHRIARRGVQVILETSTHTPNEKDLLTIGTEVWTLTDILISAGDAARCLFSRPESIERARPGYRR